MHGAWAIILDDDFIHACTYGIVIMCIDGIERRVYPRIFTYSADYPEKYVLIIYHRVGFSTSSADQGSVGNNSRQWPFPLPSVSRI